ncbi:MAG: hypothetical protein WCT10_00800 [Patescibacteria group bacterium]|jgi:hypothetical protein
MSNDFATLFSRNVTVEPPPALADRIISRIRREERLLAVQRRLILGSAGLLIAAPLAVLAMNKLMVDSAAAGVTSFLSLLATDADMVLNNFGIFSSALLEALPVTSLAGSLAAVSLTMLSLFAFVAGLGAIAIERLKQRSSFLTL